MSPTLTASTRRKRQAIVVQIAAAIEVETVVATAADAVAGRAVEVADVVAVVAGVVVTAVTVAMADTVAAGAIVAKKQFTTETQGHRGDLNSLRAQAASDRGLFLLAANSSLFLACFAQQKSLQAGDVRPHSPFRNCPERVFAGQKEEEILSFLKPA